MDTSISGENMGYANTTMVIYGARLNDKEAKKVYEKLIETAAPDDEEGYLVGAKNVKMYSEQTDSRVDTLTYDEGYPHVIGANYASNGYGCSDDIVKAIKKVPKWALKDAEVLEKFLKDMGIKKNLDVLVINQVH